MWEEHQDDIAIVAKNVWKEFDGTSVVKNVSFTVSQGEIFGFIGPSGSGKTTMVRMLVGYYVPTKGDIRVLGMPPNKLGRKGRRRLGYLPQSFVLYPNLSVMENMRFAASLYGLLPIQRRKYIRNTLEFLELWPHRKKLADDLSGGMQRRLELAAALVHNPDILFADEPTAGIDPILREHIWEGFRQLKGEGKTLFVTTQYVTEAEYCDHVALMSNGQIVAYDTPENLRRTAIGGDAIDVELEGVIQGDLADVIQFEGLKRVEKLSDNTWRFYVNNASSSAQVLVTCLNSCDISARSIKEYRPNFDEVFVRLLQDREKTAPSEASSTPH